MALLDLPEVLWSGEPRADYVEGSREAERMLHEPLVMSVALHLEGLVVRDRRGRFKWGALATAMEDQADALETVRVLKAPSVQGAFGLKVVETAVLGGGVGEAFGVGVVDLLAGVDGEDGAGRVRKADGNLGHIGRLDRFSRLDPGNTTGALARPVNFSQSAQSEAIADPAEVELLEVEAESLLDVVGPPILIGCQHRRHVQGQWDAGGHCCGNCGKVELHHGGGEQLRGVERHL